MSTHPTPKRRPGVLQTCHVINPGKKSDETA
jgi:hypothetical protein